jgi:hypothetical protein
MEMGEMSYATATRREENPLPPEEEVPIYTICEIVNFETYVIGKVFDD